MQRERLLRVLYDARQLPVDVAMRFNLERMARPSILGREVALSDQPQERKETENDTSLQRS